MISIIFNFKTKPSKNLEFMQSIGSIIVNLRKVEGCIGIDFQKDAKDNNRFLIQIDLENYGLIKTILKNKNYNLSRSQLQ